MGKFQTDKSPHLSNYGAGFIYDAAKLAEMMLENLESRNNRILPLRFWDMPEWSEEFRRQRIFASLLIKE